MLNQITTQLSAVMLTVILIFLVIHWLIWLRKKRTNVAFWATFFEGITHKTHNLDPVKEPEIFEEKLAKKDGEDKDPLSGRVI